jgi:hypothetical protein
LRMNHMRAKIFGLSRMRRCEPLLKFLRFEAFCPLAKCFPFR